MSKHKRNNPALQHKLKSLDSLLGLDEKGETVEEIPLSQLETFANHPFQVLEDEKMSETVESIRQHGVLVPITVRAKGRRTYEIISGHRRVHACGILNLETIPAVIRELSDEDAIVIMVDSNIQRESLLFSEKAFAYKMKYQALKQQGKRTDLSQGEDLQTEDTSGQVDQKSEDVTSGQVDQKLSLHRLSESVGESMKQIQRLMRLTELHPELLALVDQKILPFMVGVECSYLSQEEQEILLEVIKETSKKPSLVQMQGLRALSQAGCLTKEPILSLFVKDMTKPKPLTIKADLSEYFPEGTSQKDMEQVIVELLTQWKGQQ